MAGQFLFPSCAPLLLDLCFVRAGLSSDSDVSISVVWPPFWHFFFNPKLAPCWLWQLGRPVHLMTVAGSTNISYSKTASPWAWVTWVCRSVSPMLSWVNFNSLLFPFACIYIILCHISFTFYAISLIISFCVISFIYNYLFISLVFIWELLEDKEGVGFGICTSHLHLEMFWPVAAAFSFGLLSWPCINFLSFFGGLMSCHHLLFLPSASHNLPNLETGSFRPSAAQ